MGASATATDSTHGNTPLHWAVTSRNHHAIGILSEKPNVDFHAVNLSGETPINLFQTQLKLISEQNARRHEEADSGVNPRTSPQQFFVPRKIRDRFEDELAKSSKASNVNINRHSKSSHRVASFAKDNALTRSIATFFKDKKVLIYNEIAVSVVGTSSKFNFLL